jgi:sialate O-acetylesterase
MKPILTILLLVPLTLRADSTIKPAALFTDHMVLQRDQAVPVWGLAGPGEEVAVEFAGQKKTAKASAEGRWMVKLDPLKASAEPRELKAGAVVIRDVLVGDVWLCSGQSNMHFQMKSVLNAPQEIAAMDFPNVRYFTVGQNFGLQPLNDVSGEWNPVSPATAASCSAVACYFGTALQQKLGVPIGLIVSSVGGTRIESWMRAETLASTGESASLVEKWKQIPPDEFGKIGEIYREFQRQRDQVHPQAVRAAKEKGEPVPPEPKAPKLRCHDCPSALHNGMIEPLEPFAIRGTIWYQGESNSGQPGPYEKLLPAMIADWRKVWRDDLPFLFVQLAPHRNTHPAFREAQQRIWQKTPHTAMAVTVDVGDAANIHPTRKRPVGERLALAARAVAYGEKVEYSGPVFKNMKIGNDRAVISFDHAKSGLMANLKDLNGFTIAGKDGNFVPATAEIEGSTVIVNSTAIARPVAVRYAWANVPEGNLFNHDGLPAAPFRSDAGPAND